MVNWIFGEVELGLGCDDMVLVGFWELEFG